MCLFSARKWPYIRAYHLIFYLSLITNFMAWAENPGNGDGAPSASRVEFDSIRSLHQKLDEDLSGYIDLKESDEFLKDELKVQTKSKERLSTFHNDDPQITVDDLWRTWSVSEVHNWTVDQVVDWLVQHVELPQYSASFRRLSLDGSQLPRLATNVPEFLTSTLGVRDPIHKRKLLLKATDAVLFGSPRSRDILGKYKEWIFLASLLIASCGIWFAFSQRRKYETQMQHMSADLDRIKALEKDLAEMQSAESTGLATRIEDDAMSLSPAERERLYELEHENGILRDAVQRAEHRAQSTQWHPPVDLELLLQKTYMVELSYFQGKRLLAEKQLLNAKEECEKLHKKQQSVLGAFRVTHGSQLNNVDDQLVLAKTALSALASDIHDRNSRWKRIEALTGHAITSPRNASEGSNQRDKSARPVNDDDQTHSAQGMVRGSVRRPGPGSVISGRRISGEVPIDAFSVHSDEIPLNIGEGSRRAGYQGLNRENGSRDAGFDSDLDAQKRSKSGVIEANDVLLRRAPEVRGEPDLHHQFSINSESSGRSSPPAGAVDSDSEKVSKKNPGFRKVLSNISLMHKKGEH